MPYYSIPMLYESEHMLNVECIVQNILEHTLVCH